MNPSPSPSSGNVLFLILIAVALFAALSYAVTASTNGGSNSSDGENVTLQVSSALQQFAGWTAAIQKMSMVNDCSDTEVSVAHPQLSSFYATASGSRNPARPECKLFDITGGGQSYNKPDAKLNGSKNIGFYSNFAISGIGNQNSTLISVIPAVSKDFCQLYNKKVGMGAGIPQYTSGAFSLTNPYSGTAGLGTGSYTWGVSASRCPECANHHAFCVEFTNTFSFANIEPAPFPAGYYAFYALWER